MNPYCLRLNNGTTPYRCRNSQCVDHPAQCSQNSPYYEGQVQQLVATVDALAYTSIPFQFDSDMQALASLLIPSGSLRINENSQNIQRVMINGVPDSLLLDMLNPIVPARRPAITANISELIDGKFLAQKYSLISPVIWIQNLDEAFE